MDRSGTGVAVELTFCLRRSDVATCRCVDGALLPTERYEKCLFVPGIFQARFLSTNRDGLVPGADAAVAHSAACFPSCRSLLKCNIF